MNISNELAFQLPYQEVISYKQRLAAVNALFDADLAVCLVRHGESWSVVALHGPLASDERRVRIPELTLKMTLEEGRGVRSVEALGDIENNVGGLRVRAVNGLFVSTVSAIMNEGSLVFIAAKQSTKGRFRDEEVETFNRYLTAYEEAGI